MVKKLYRNIFSLDFVKLVHFVIVLNLIDDFIMKNDIHPEYRAVLFHDVSVDEYFVINSTLKTDQTKKWKDGKTYPYYTLDVSSASHPFYTGKHKIVDTGGRVQRFEKRFGKNK